MTFVGIGVDYGIHLVHRCAHGADGDRADAVAHLGPVILVAALTTLLRLRDARHLVLPAAALARARLDGRDRRARRRVAVRPAGAPPQAAPMTASEPLRVVAVIAAFNEGRHIREVVLGTRPHVDAVIVVDDRLDRRHGRRGGGRRRRGGAASRQPRQGRRRAERPRRRARPRLQPRAAAGRRPAAPAVGRAAPRRGGGRGRCRRHRRRPELRPGADAGVALLVQRHRQLGARRPRRRPHPGHAIRLPADPAGGPRAAHADVDRLRDRDRDADPARPPRVGRPRSAASPSPTTAPPASSARSATPRGPASSPSTTASSAGTEPGRASADGRSEAGPAGGPRRPGEAGRGRDWPERQSCIAPDCKVICASARSALMTFHPFLANMTTLHA